MFKKTVFEAREMNAKSETWVIKIKDIQTSNVHTEQVVLRKLEIGICMFVTTINEKMVMNLKESKVSIWESLEGGNGREK